MNITSYVTDVGYHYIGLRVLNGLSPAARREEQTVVISRNVRKYVSDRALRLMLPEPRGTFETAGEKICQELVHLKFAQSANRAYELTAEGVEALTLLNGRKYGEVRRIMAKAHLRTYDNLRLVVKRHLEIDEVWRPIVSSENSGNRDYVASLLAPTFGEEAGEQAEQALSEVDGKGTRKLEDALRQLVLQKTIPEMRLGVPIFRVLCDRLVSLRLLNQIRVDRGIGEFLKTYSPCVASNPPNDWYFYLNVHLNTGEPFELYLCEPDMTKRHAQDLIIEAVREAFNVLDPTAGYFDLPEVRDIVCESLRIPEAAFDEGLNRILDLEPSPFTVGFQYEGMTGRRKPLVRSRGSTQIYNLVRRA